MTSRAVAVCTLLGSLLASARASAQDGGIEGRVGGVGLLSSRTARFDDAVGTGSGTLTGLEISLRHRYLGLTARSFGGDFTADSGVAAVGAIRSTSVWLLLGPRIIAAEVGYGNRAFRGSFATRHWGYLHVGARSTVPIGATGLSAEVGLAVYAGLSGAAGESTSGREADTRLIYAPTYVPLYAAIGYRAERFTIDGPSDTRPEAVSGFLLAVGVRIRR